ncbi:DUF1636 domain-containing protein [Acetobacter lambici]|uniref:DUF1636 domain-containing protein n=1 Tax=Acetobacter lambici TaxID=1332824 RepID=A0ABT1F1R2_9PROT|nr:DUF1636 domain-containing protein [Acetobacter lambici]MCP1242980.1 DUF1636 domain-containing protein [Acetobacter lambici]MCP1259150.1 DUF1636 domain-containing protein [Acetobacter lambici]NHO57356.1 DUF1636 domain-containing protein [Acetobacter lambici]
MTAEHASPSPPDNSAYAGPPVLHVCVTCRRGGPAMDCPPGAQLLERLQGLLDAEHLAGLAPSASVRPVACLAACDRGCTAAIAMPGRWTWLLGHLGEEKAEDILAYARLYAASAKGTVMPSRRPESLANMVQGRVPAILYNEQEKP